MTIALRSILLGLACPPLYLGRRRRWVGAVLVGLVWAFGVTLAGTGLYAMARYPVQSGHVFVLYVGLLFWLVSSFLGWLWNWRPLVALLAVLLVLVLFLVLTVISSWK